MHRMMVLYDAVCCSRRRMVALGFSEKAWSESLRVVFCESGLVEMVTMYENWLRLEADEGQFGDAAANLPCV